MKQIEIGQVRMWRKNTSIYFRLGLEKEDNMFMILERIIKKESVWCSSGSKPPVDVEYYRVRYMLSGVIRDYTDQTLRCHTKTTNAFRGK